MAACHQAAPLHDARFSDWHFPEGKGRVQPCGSLGRYCLPYKYVLTAYLTVFTVGVLLGMAFSPATPQELQWLAERSARLRAARELPPQVPRVALGTRAAVHAQVGSQARGAGNESTAHTEVRLAREETVELRRLEAKRLPNSEPALVLSTAGLHEETR